MFCKECGAEIPNDAKHCPDCGAKLVNDTPIVQEERVEKESFFKKNKKVLIGCCIGIIVIFVIIALITSGSNQTDVDNDLSSGIQSVLEDAGYSVSDSVEDGSVKLNAINVDLNDKNSNSEIIEVYIFDSGMLDAVASEYGLSPREINGIDGYGGYSEKVYTYAFEDNGNTVVILAPSKDSAILDTIVKDY